MTDATVQVRSRRQPKPAAVLAVAGFGAFLAFLDSTVVNVAFPSIRASFPGSSLSTLSWVLNAYNVVFAGFLVASGRFADLLGRRRTFVFGTLVFTLASVACAASTSVGMLIASRVVQGLGCAVLVPASLAMVIDAFPDHRLTEGVTLWGATAALAAGLGPPVGGALVNAGNWRWAFVINIPLGLLAVVLARRATVESRAPGRRRLPDVLGTFLLIAALTGLTLGIVQGHDWGWTSARLLICLAVALAVLVAFGVQNARHPVPMLDPALLRTRRFAVANVVTLVAGAGFYAYGLTHILWLRYVWGYSLLDAGLAVAPGALAAAVAAALLGRLAEHRGHRPVVVIGAIVWALALTWYATRIGLRPDFLGQWLPGQIISGIGVGATLPIVTGAALVGVPGGRYAAASAAVSSTRQFGAVLGIAILVAIIGNPSAATAAAAFRHGWAFSAGCFALVAVLALFLGRDHVPTAMAVVHRPAEQASPAAETPEPVVATPASERWELSLFASLSERSRSALEAALVPVELAAGEFLFRQGDAADGLYVVRSGQLEVLIDDLVVSRLGSGDVIGELALLTDEPRSASIRARRDSRVELLTAEAFARLSRAQPDLPLALGRRIAARLQQLTPPVVPPSPGRVVAVVGTDPDAPTREVSAALVRSMSRHLRVTDPGVVTGSGLERAENAHDRVVLTAPYGDDDYRAFCLRSADRVVFVATGPTPPHASLLAAHQDCDVVIVGADPSRPDLLAWHEWATPISVHRASAGADLEIALRGLSARLAQRAIGLVLAGGGARSLAHLGVIEELERAGILVDRVAGTSAGAVVAAFLAEGLSADEIDAVVYEEFVRRNPLGDITLPRRGLIKGERTRTALRRHFGDRLFEELPRELHVVSVDLMHRMPVIHSRGSVSDAVAASLRIPGVFPPLGLGGVVHVDGAVLDNVPVGALERTPDGPIVAVNISMGGGGSSSGRTSPRPVRIPGMAETLMRTMFMSSALATSSALARADVVITPRTSEVGFFEWHQIDVLREAGQRAAAEAMPALLALAEPRRSPEHQAAVAEPMAR
ncbi:MAG: DHA2 family efflux MFS transporter permease subunit [Jatrophihabitans sp.]|nr:MAG: DHA2 family efflux MFS transporter permease subunit [Jatrophihabitans sp.]